MSENTKEHPVLFQTAMIQAILKGHKTMTRRPRQLGSVGDVLWVRETFAWHPDYIDGSEPIYKADGFNDHDDIKWKPSIFMPKRICRLRLRITHTRQEHLADISETDALKEGIILLDGDELYKPQTRYHWLPLKRQTHNGITLSYSSAKDAFRGLWDSINGIGVFDNNPLVWVHEFERVKYYE